MLLLAMDHSTRTGDLALLADGQVVARRSWQQAARGRSDLSGHIAAVLAEHAVGPADIDSFAVGLGPGIYSSLRISLSTVNGLALPGRRPVHGVCSARPAGAVRRARIRQGFPSTQPGRSHGAPRRDRHGDRVYGHARHVGGPV